MEQPAITVESVHNGADHCQPLPLKRPRGRPRIHPPKPKKPLIRTRTGCKTCRRRKKKCDESGFPCFNCVKTAGVVCEGYPNPAQNGTQLPNQRRRSDAESVSSANKESYSASSPDNSFGGERAASESLSSAKVSPMMANPTPFLDFDDGFETNLDRFLLKHATDDLFGLLSIGQDERNPFVNLILPMAFTRPELMHAILCLSASHLQHTTNEGRTRARRDYHYQQALSFLAHNKELSKHNCAAPGDISNSTRALAVILCLASSFGGDKDGSFVPHVTAIGHYVRCRPSQEDPFASFLDTFWQYLVASLTLTSTSRPPDRLPPSPLRPPPSWYPEAEDASFLGLPHQLFGCLCRVRELRDVVRWQRTSTERVLASESVAIDAREVDEAIRRTCRPSRGGDDQSFSANALLYRRCIWIYLHRTVGPLVPNPPLSDAVDEALQSIQHLPSEPATMVALLLPLFILGCSAFDSRQRLLVRAELHRLRDFRHAGSITCTLRILEVLWMAMDAGRDCWDWEQIIGETGWQFLLI